MARAVPLQRPEVVCVSQFGTERLKDRPVVLLALASQLAIHEAHQIGDHAVVVQQSVVHVEQCHKGMHRYILIECSSSRAANMDPLWQYAASERTRRTMKVGWTAAAVMAMMLSAGARGALAQGPSQAQGPGAATSPFLGSVPKGTVTATPLSLSAKDAVQRALQNNLGLLLQEEAETFAHGARWQALADLLPNVSGSVAGHRQVINLEAFGFNPRALGLPSPLVGPFPIFDARAFVSAPIVDLSALNESRAASANEKAAKYNVKNA